MRPRRALLSPAIVALLASVSAACVTDPNGNSCTWMPGGDGYCPEKSGGGPEVPSFHVFGDPRLLIADGVAHVLVVSAGDDYRAREELALEPPADGTPAERVQVEVADTGFPAIACGEVCVAAWQERDTAIVHTAIRSAAGWTVAEAHEVATRAPAVATVGDRVLVAWSTWENDVGARVELRSLDLAGRVLDGWTLAEGASHGHLSLAAGPDGALVTWERIGEAEVVDGYWFRPAWLVAQPLDLAGSPLGAPFELPVADGTGDFYQAAPAALIDGAYRVTHDGLEEGVTWLVIDPIARTIVPETIAELTNPRAISSIVPRATGAVVGLSAADGGAVTVIEDGRVVRQASIGRSSGAPAVAQTADGLAVGYIDASSLHVARWSDDLVPTGDATLLAERYELEKTGCAAGGRGGASGGLVMVVVAIALATRRSWRRAVLDS